MENIDLTFEDEMQKRQYSLFVSRLIVGIIFSLAQVSVVSFGKNFHEHFYSAFSFDDLKSAYDEISLPLKFEDQPASLFMKVCCHPGNLTTLQSFPI